MRARKRGEKAICGKEVPGYVGSTLTAIRTANRLEIGKRQSGNVTRILVGKGIELFT